MRNKGSGYQGEGKHCEWSGNPSDGMLGEVEAGAARQAGVSCGATAQEAERPFG